MRSVEIDFELVKESGLAKYWNDTRRIAETRIKRDRDVVVNFQAHGRENCADVPGSDATVQIGISRIEPEV
jgi:hypothetical protein